MICQCIIRSIALRPLTSTSFRMNTYSMISNTGSPMRMTGNAIMAANGKMSIAGSSKKCETVSGWNKSASIKRWWLGRIWRLRAMSSSVARNGATCRPASIICNTVFLYCEASCPTPMKNRQPIRIGSAINRGMDSSPAAQISSLVSMVAIVLISAKRYECFNHRVRMLSEA